MCVDLRFASALHLSALSSPHESRSRFALAMTSAVTYKYSLTVPVVFYDLNFDCRDVANKI